MTEPGLAMSAVPAGSEPDDQERRAGEAPHGSTHGGAPDTGRPRPLGFIWLLVLGVLWLATRMWGAHAAIAGAGGDPTLTLSMAALELPGVIAASLLAGIAAGVTAVRRFTPGRTAVLRGLVGICAGALSGLVATSAVLIAYGPRASVAVLAATVGISAALGGSLAATRPIAAVASGVAATLGVFVVDQVVSQFQSPLKSLFGAGQSAASQVAATGWFSLTLALAAGLVAGLVAFRYLHRREPELRWPAYLLAGATPGVVLIVAEVITRVGGARLLGLVSSLSSGDQTALSYLGASRINHALVVGFLGAIVAVISFGRTLRPADPGPAGTDGTEPRTTAGPGTETGAESRAGTEPEIEAAAGSEAAAEETGEQADGQQPGTQPGAGSGGNAEDQDDTDAPVTVRIVRQAPPTS